MPFLIKIISILGITLMVCVVLILCTVHMYVAVHTDYPLGT